MPPFWPFRKKETVAELNEAPPAPVVYKRGEDPNARKTIEADADAYKDALALFGDGSKEVKAASDQSVNYDGVSASTSHTPLVPEPSFEWVHHTDGYHYKRLADGAFEPTPHTKNKDGNYTPYS